MCPFSRKKQIYCHIRMVALLRILSGQAQVYPCGASAGPCQALSVCIVLDNDIRLILSCFVEANAALLGQAQVCILVAHQQSPVEP